jgi:uncharacterized protein (DUF2132 family)
MEISQWNVDHEMLHWVTLKAILEHLIEKYWFKDLDERFRINCFANNPSLNSSLKFLRKTEWARVQVQGLYVRSKTEDRKKSRK